VRQYGDVLEDGASISISVIPSFSRGWFMLLEVTVASVLRSKMPGSYEPKLSRLPTSCVRDGGRRQSAPDFRVLHISPSGTAGTKEETGEALRGPMLICKV
jgi:hypothetical protein